MSIQLDSTDAIGAIRWKRYKKLHPDQGIDKIPQTYGAWHQHIVYIMNSYANYTCI